MGKVAFMRFRLPFPGQHFVEVSSPNPPCAADLDPRHLARVKGSNHGFAADLKIRGGLDDRQHFGELLICHLVLLRVGMIHLSYKVAQRHANTRIFTRAFQLGDERHPEPRPGLNRAAEI